MFTILYFILFCVEYPPSRYKTQLQRIPSGTCPAEYKNLIPNLSEVVVDTPQWPEVTQLETFEDGLDAVVDWDDITWNGLIYRWGVGLAYCMTVDPSF